jgi:hypothetical protein
MSPCLLEDRQNSEIAVAQSGEYTHEEGGCVHTDMIPAGE